MEQTKELKLMANKLRVDSLKSTTAAGSGHPTSCLSCAEIMSCLFFSEMEEEDEFILSKGHAAPILWSAYAEAGCIPEEELNTLRRIDSVLEGHPTARMPLVRVATGSLGQGLSAGVGMALAKRLKNSRGRIYVLLGDGESAEGSVWEAANSASHYRLNNLCALVDVNRLGQSEPTMHGHDLKAYRRKFEAFGWEAVEIDGHKISDSLDALEAARKSKKPFAIIAKTFKGKGISFLEDKEGWHGKALSRDKLDAALKEIGEAEIRLSSKVSCHRKLDYRFVDFWTNRYDPFDLVATRTALGKALVNLGEKNKNVVVIDADVKNSTMTEGFFKAYPERSFQSFIAEQNMVGMAIGFSAMGFNPWVATFSTFLTRAHDFIRMALYSAANVKFVGSHAGISIGPDGPSQMGLEDISMFLSMPKAVVLYPGDAVSTEYLVAEMAKHRGISYLRTTREQTPVIYEADEEFPIGGLKVLRKSDRDKAMIVSAGITLHEALKAYEILKERGIYIRVIDLYSLQPFDAQSLINNAGECHHNVIAVEDHYCNALGSVVSSVLEKVRHLCVRGIPRSGKPEELMARYGLDAATIVKLVKRI